ncbi:MAG: acyltransferase [Gammaproteobacteria bacterium]|nr:acyltransferase [Gammaproteobacteria bacterium]
MKLGRDAEPVLVATSTDNRIAAVALVKQGRRYLYIFSRDLDASVYDTTTFVSAVRELATYSRYSQIRILVQNSEHIAKHGHRLVQLAHRLSSFIQVRKPGRDHQALSEAFLVVDKLGLLHRKMSDRYDGVVNFNAPLEATALVRFFDEVWDRSEPDPELRRLYI